MSKEICISTTPHETRLAILENDELTEIYYERENEYTLAGSIYKGKVTRVLPGMQSAFVDVGLERDAFLYVTDFLEEQEDGEEFESANGGGTTAGTGWRTRRRSGAGSAAAGSHSQNRRRRSGLSVPARGRQTIPIHRAGRVAGADAVDASGDSARAGSRMRPAQGEPGRDVAGTPRSIQVVDEPFEAEPEAAQEYRAPIAAQTATPAAGQRTLLPGESLSKYGATSTVETRESEAPRSRHNSKPTTRLPSPRR